MGLKGLFVPNVEKLKTKRRIKGLLKALKYEKDPEIRRAAAEALRERGDAKAVEPLIQALSDENEQLQKAVVKALGDIGDTKAVEPLLQFLKNTFNLAPIEDGGKPPKKTFRLNMLSGFGEELWKITTHSLGRVNAGQILIQLLKEEINCLYQRTGNYKYGMLPTIDNPKPWRDTINRVRKAVSDALVEIGDIDILIESFKEQDTLSKEILSDKGRQMFWKTCIIALITIEDENALKSLTHFIQNNKHLVYITRIQEMAIEAIAEVSDEKIEEHFIQFLKHEDPDRLSRFVKMVITNTLDNLHDEKAKERLVCLFKNDDRKIHEIATKFIQQLQKTEQTQLKELRTLKMKFQEEVNIEKIIEEMKGSLYKTKSEFEGGLEDRLYMAERIFLSNHHFQDELIKKLENPSRSKELAEVGFELYKLQKHQEAILFFKRSLNFNPNNARVWFLKAICYGELGMTKKELTCLEESLKIDPENAIAWHLEGTALAALGDFQMSVESYEKSLRIKPDNPKVLYLKGQALANLGKHDEATEWMKKAQELDPNNSRIKNNLDGMLAQQTQAREDSEEKAEQAICDLCNAQTSKLSGTLYSAAEFRRLVSNGLTPSKTTLMPGGITSMLGITEQQALQFWKQQTVDQSTTDWLLCPSCTAKAKKYEKK